jgi:2,3-bisphosphoglycerate-independent phosphoglycerate mutase
VKDVKRPKPVALVILDGWGLAEVEKNATSVAKTPNFERLLSTYPSTTLEASGEKVGLMPGQMGDSNVGHLNLGAGRIVYQDVMRITRDIQNGSFFRNPALVEAFDHVIEHGSQIHFMGLLSDGGVHSLDTHLFALLNMAKMRGLEHVFVHAFLDGRDVPPKSAAKYLSALEDKFAEIGVGRLSSMVGRYYAMDRDKRFERVEKAYRLLTEGEGNHAPNWREALDEAYANGETDEFVSPVKFLGNEGIISDGDAVVFFNFRSDRAREITHALLDEDFSGFQRVRVPKIFFCGMMRYEEGILGRYAYLPLEINNTLGEVVSNSGLRQIRIAETEKYAHVTFFFNGKKDDPYPGEERALIPSPKEVATYDLKPEMSACPVTERAISEIRSKKYDLVVLNYANPDMVGHTGVFPAGVKALEAVDECLGDLVNVILEEGGVALICADHGNIEELVETENQEESHTYHTSNEVPCILVGCDEAKGLRPGILADVAPTLLELLGIPKPKEMEGQSLILR